MQNWSSISKFVAGARYSYDYESHVQLKQEAFVKAAQSRSRHLSFKTNAKLAVTYLWHHNGKNETILQVQVNINLVFYPLDLSHKIYANYWHYVNTNFCQSWKKCSIEDLKWAIRSLESVH